MSGETEWKAATKAAGKTKDRKVAPDTVKAVDRPWSYEWAPRLGSVEETNENFF